MRKLFFCLLLTLMASQASAQIPMKICPDGRQASPDGYCYQYTSPPPPPVSTNFSGAIAHAKGKGSGSFSWANDFSTTAKAEAAALAECRKANPTSTCYIVDSFANRCVAIAAGSKYYALAYGVKRKEAEDRAMRTCSGTDKHQCKIEFSLCPS